MNILFLCTGNSCHSIIAEALFREIMPHGVTVQSAGSSPAGYVHPRALAALEKAGVATGGLYSKSWDDLKTPPDVVITLCADAAGEACPVFFGTFVRSHWGMPDPAKVTGDEETVNTAFSKTLNTLRPRVNALAHLPFKELRNKGQKLQNALDAIAAL